MSQPKLVIFDKDGTLLSDDLWHEVMGALLENAVPEHNQRDAAVALGYDLGNRLIRIDSPLLSESNRQVVDRIFPFTGHSDREAFLGECERMAAAFAIEMVEELPGATLVLNELAEAGVSLAVCTNDSEGSSRAQLERMGWATLLPMVFGYDSGHGWKPDPGMVLAALAQAGCAPEDAVLVGDSSADIGAGQAAAVTTVYVGDHTDLGRSADRHVLQLTDLLPLLLP